MIIINYLVHMQHMQQMQEEGEPPPPAPASSSDCRTPVPGPPCQVGCNTMAPYCSLSLIIQPNMT